MAERSRFERRRRAYCVILVAVASACLDSARADSTALTQTADGPVLRVAIEGDSTDVRVPAAREALEFWNREFLKLGRRVRFESRVVRRDTIPDDLLRAAAREVVVGFGPGTLALRKAASTIPADVVIVLSNADLVSFSLRWKAGGRGVVGVRRADIPPLTLPNTVRNVVAHEVGHVLGLDHNSDQTTLMCGRPAPCRPAAFASDPSRFFPLTPADERRIQNRWP